MQQHEYETISEEERTTGRGRKHVDDEVIKDIDEDYSDEKASNPQIQVTKKGSSEQPQYTMAMHNGDDGRSYHMMATEHK